MYNKYNMTWAGLTMMFCSMFFSYTNEWFAIVLGILGIIFFGAASQMKDL